MEKDILKVINKYEKKTDFAWHDLEKDISALKPDFKKNTELSTEIEAWNFVIQHDKGLSPSGGTINKENEKYTSEWPDIKTFRKEKIQYIHRRYEQTKSLKFKCQYGLILYYKNAIQDDNLPILLNQLFEFGKILIQKETYTEEINFYGAIFIILKRENKNKNLLAFKNNIIDYLIKKLESHLTNNNENGLFRLLLLLNTHHSFFKKSDLNIFISSYLKLKEVSDKSIYEIYEKIASLLKKLGDERYKLFLEKKAEIHFKKFEKEKVDFRAANQLGHAINIYKALGMKARVDELNVIYQKIPKDDYLQSYEYDPLGKDLNKIFHETLSEIASRSTAKDILTKMAKLYFTDKIKDIQLASENKRKKGDFFDTITKINYDGKGNIRKISDTSEEEYFYDTYQHYFLADINYFLIFLHVSKKNNKLNLKDVLSYFRSSWIGQKCFLNENGKDIEINQLEYIKDSLTHVSKLILATKKEEDFQKKYYHFDNLVLKVEFLLKNMALLLNLNILKNKNGSKSHHLTEIKNGYEILKTLEGKIEQSDFIFLKYVLYDEYGFNLRNSVAHNLYYKHHYNSFKHILIFLCLLKLAKYNFR